MSDYEGMLDADKGSFFETLHLETRLKNRIKYDLWDGNPRACKTCGKSIEPIRLKLVNAIQCKNCVMEIEDE